MNDAELDEAVRAAKMQAGLNPNEKHLPMLYVGHMTAEAQAAFWARQVDRVLVPLVEAAEREAGK